MTPFGEKLKKHRLQRGLTLSDLSKVLKVSKAYISQIENGKRGRPSQGMVELICAYFGLIWDEVETLKKLSKISDPNVSINTKNLSKEATRLSNTLSLNIQKLSSAQADDLTVKILKMSKKK